MKKLIVGSRASRLALLQANSVIDRLNAAKNKCAIHLCKIVTSGDNDRHTQLERLGAAAFVKELEEALLDRRIDIAIHSLKDVPTTLPEGLCLAAVSERIDPRDTLVSASGLMDLPQGSTIATGSLRRAVQLVALRPDLKTCSIRGNIDTRLRKVVSGEADGLIMAAAALIRLGWQDRIREFLPVEHFLPAVGQGAIAIEARSCDNEVLSMVAELNDKPAWQAITAERAFLHALGGGCRAPIAALGRVGDNSLRLEGMVAGITSRKVLRLSIEGRADDAEDIGKQLAAQLIRSGAADLIAEAEGK